MGLGNLSTLLCVVILIHGRPKWKKSWNPKNQGSHVFSIGSSSGVCFFFFLSKRLFSFWTRIYSGTEEDLGTLVQSLHRCLRVAAWEWLCWSQWLCSIWTLRNQSQAPVRWCPGPMQMTTAQVSEAKDFFPIIKHTERRRGEEPRRRFTHPKIKTRILGYAYIYTESSSCM